MPTYSIAAVSPNRIVGVEERWMSATARAARLSDRYISFYGLVSQVEGGRSRCLSPGSPAATTTLSRRISGWVVIVILHLCGYVCS